MCNISRQATRLEVLRLLCIHVDAWMHRKLIKPPFRLQPLIDKLCGILFGTPFTSSMSSSFSLLSISLFPLCCRPFWSLFCRLAHVTRIFAQLKSIKLHFRLNKLGCHTLTRPHLSPWFTHPLCPVSAPQFVYMSGLLSSYLQSQPSAAASAPKFSLPDFKHTFLSSVCHFFGFLCESLFLVFYSLLLNICFANIFKVI